MAIKKPYPGMGPYVVVLEDYPGEWSAYAGANTLERARQRRRELPQWPNHKIAIVTNQPGDPKK